MIKCFNFYILIPLVLYLTIGINLTHARKLNKDKSELYKRYPQLLQEKNGCVKGMREYLINFFESPQNQMTFYSTHQIMELGYYDQCNGELGEFGSFVVLNANITHLIGTARMGICLPKECTQADYDSFTVPVVDFVNSIFDVLQKEYNPHWHGMLFREWTRVGLNLVKSDEYTENWRNRTSSGVIPTLIIVILIVMVAFMGNGIRIYYYNQYKCQANRIDRLDQQISSEMLQSQDRTTQVQSYIEEREQIEPRSHNFNNNATFNQINQQRQDNQFDRARKTVTFSQNLEQTQISNGDASNNVQVMNINNTYKFSDIDRTPSPSHILSHNSQLNLDSRITTAPGEQPKTLKSILLQFSAQHAFYDLLGGYTREYDNKELDIFNAIKFFNLFLILITCTATYLILADALNPWIMVQFFESPIFTILIAGLVAIDTFFTFSAFFAFYRISQIYDAKNGLSALDVIKIYAKRLLRILPLYYLTFLVGMFVIPRVASGGVWYMYEQALYFECDKYWWTNVLLINNFVPWDQSAKGGCMPWTWAIAADFQLYLLIPFYVILYKKRRNIALGLFWLILALGTITIMVIVIENNLTAGAYTLENWFLWQAYLNKPYCKLQVHIAGIFGAVLYMEILEYRKDPIRNSKLYRKIDFCCKNWIFGKVLLWVGVVMVVVNLFIAYTCSLTPYDWSKFGNAVFFATTRFTFSLGYMFIAFYIIFGHSNIGRLVLANYGFNATGKLVYIIYLITPIIMMVVYSSSKTGVYMTMINCIYLGMGHMMVGFIIGLLIYVLLSWPLTIFNSICLDRFVSHEKIVRESYIQKKKDEESERNKDLIMMNKVQDKFKI